MSLIKCPKCGKEISDKAKKCPFCECELKKDTIKTCPECHKYVDIFTKVCPYCGYPFKENKKLQKIKSLVHFGKKTQAFIILIVIIFIVSIASKKENVFKEYTNYIGKSYEKLPNGYNLHELIDGFWYAECGIKAGNEKFSFVDGTIRYSYFEEEKDVYDTKENEIFCMSWYPEYESIENSDIEDTKKLLEKAYGKFNKMTEFDNNSEIFDYETDSFLCERYLWNDKKGIDIFMDVKSENDDDLGKIYTSINVTWIKRKSKN